MPKQYSCNYCGKVFSQKIDFTRHASKKNACVSLTEIKQMVQSNTVDNEFKSVIKNIFKDCLNVLRNEGLTGEKALRNITYMITLKIIEDTGEDIANTYNYNFEEIDEYTKDILLQNASFSKLCQASINEEKDLPKRMNFLWEYILSKHPATRYIFLPEKRFDIQHQTNYKRVINRVADLPKAEHDVLGQAYEEVIQDIMVGKVLGQFFTPTCVKRMMVDLINPQVYPDGHIDTCGDPTMGTGGFLIDYIRHIIQKAKKDNIALDWNFIKTEGLYGKEIVEETFQLAVSNMLISTGHIFTNLEKGDSIRDPIDKKFDNILANPPFGIKGLTYNDIKSPIRDKYVPIQTDNAVSLFIQAIIYMLKIEGKCAVVLPDGQDLFSKSNKTLVSIREYLMKTCNLKEIIYLPAGVFENTTIKTCVFYFIKKCEGTEVLTIGTKVSKSLKGGDKTYKFISTHQTTNVDFYDCNPVNGAKNLLVSVPISQIANNSYSLNYSEYRIDEVDGQYDKEVVVTPLGEVCDFLPKSKRPASYGNTHGQYPFFTSSKDCTKYCDESDYNEECLIIGDGGEPNINYGCKFSASDHCYILQNKTKSSVNLKYIYYYLYHNLDIMNELYTGVAIKNISKTKIQGILIPIPSLESQNYAVEYLDFIYEETIQTSLHKIAQLKRSNEFGVSNHARFGYNVVNTLNELCDFLPKSKRQASYGNTHGQYPFFTSSQECTKYCNEYDYNEECLIIGTGGTANVKYSRMFSCSADNFVMLSKDRMVLKYVYYYLTYNITLLQNGFFGVGLQHISKEYVGNIKIPIPSLDRQREIVAYCEKNDELIKQLEKDIDTQKNQAHLFINSIVQSNPPDNHTEPNEISAVDQMDDIDSLVFTFKTMCVIKDTPLNIPENIEAVTPVVSNISTMAYPTNLPFEKWSKVQLYAKCKEFQLKGMSGKPKPDLIKRLNEYISLGGGEV